MSNQNASNLPLNVISTLKNQLINLESQLKQAESLHSLIVSMGRSDYTLDYKMQTLKDKIDSLKKSMKASGITV